MYIHLLLHIYIFIYIYGEYVNIYVYTCICYLAKFSAVHTYGTAYAPAVRYCIQYGERRAQLLQSI